MSSCLEDLKYQSLLMHNDVSLKYKDESSMSAHEQEMKCSVNQLSFVKLSLDDKLKA